MADNKNENKKFGGWWNTVVVASIVSALGLGDGEASAKNNGKSDIPEKGKVENIDRTSASDSLKVSKIEERSVTDNKQEQTLRKQENVSEISQDKGYVVGSHLANSIGGIRRTRVSYSRYGVTQTPRRPFMGGYTFSTTSSKGTETVSSVGAGIEKTTKSEVDNSQDVAPKKKSWFARLFSRKEKDNNTVNPTVADATKHAKIVIAQPWYQTFKFDSNNPEASFKEWAEKAGKTMPKDKMQMAINALPLAYREVGAHIRRWTEHAHQKGYKVDWNELPKNYKKELVEANETYAQQLGGSKGRNVNIASIGNRINKRMEGRRGDITGGKWNIGRS